MSALNCIYRETCNICRALVGRKIADHSDVVGASPVGAASIAWPLLYYNV